MLGLAGDDGAQGDDGVHVVALEHLLHGHGDLEHPGDQDGPGDLDSEELRLGLGPFDHEGGDLEVELRGDHTDSVLLHLSSPSLKDRPLVGEALPEAGSGPLCQALRTEEQVVDVGSVLPGPAVGQEGELSVVLGLVLVDEDLDNVFVRHQLREHEPCGGLVGAHLVLLHGPGHAQGHDDVAPLLLQQLLAGHREVLEARDGVAHDGEPRAGPLELVDGRAAHVVPGECGVCDSYLLHGAPPMLRILAIILRVALRSSAHSVALTTLMSPRPASLSLDSSSWASNFWSYPRTITSGLT